MKTVFPTQSLTPVDDLHAATGSIGGAPVHARHEGSVALKWFEHAPGFVAILIGPDCVFSHANEAYERLVGRGNLIGSPFMEVLPEMASQGVVDLLEQVVRSGEAYVERGREILLRRADGRLESRYIDFVMQPITDPAGAVSGVLLQGSDVSIEKFSQQELQYTLTTDRVTGLPNYTLFRDRLEQAIMSADLGRRSVVLAALELDRFERVTASVGYEAGDLILRDIGQRLKLAAGDMATVARENGDKFLLILDADPERGDVHQVQALVAALAEPISSNGPPLYIGCSAGVATYPADGQTADALLRAVDRALSLAKAAGPGVVCSDAEPGGAGEVEHFELASALHQALDDGKLAVHYQPQVDLVSGDIVGVEALVRWTDPVHGQVPPPTLIRVAEDSGLIARLGDWVLRSACAQMAAWHAMGYGRLRVAVNISARQFAMRGLEASVVRALADSGLPPDCLDLELTESQLMLDLEHAVECLRTLKERGVRLSLDDFGTGYSSLAYLQRLPIDVLKIEKSFLDRVPESDEASVIVEAVITMGHALGMRIVAEGVEREAQCDFLARHMCDEIQGYFVSPPVPPEQMTALLRERRPLPPQLLRFHRPRPTLLLVDDEASILSSLRRLLRNDGYRILTAASGAEGLEVLAGHTVDVIVSDQRMPGMTGVEFLRSVRQLYPDTVRIVLSGFTELQTVTDAVNAGAIYKFLTKPWDDTQLRTHIREAFSHGAMANENRMLGLQVRTANQQLASVNRQLEDVLERQRRQIEHGEISLDIVREALSNVPVPVLASDDTGMIVLANRAAVRLFREHGPVLGSDAWQLVPNLPVAPALEASLPFTFRLGQRTLSATVQSMGHGTHSRGWLIAVTGGWDDS
ncbi:MAG: EAL domain-containing protein [Telluria sp.]